MTAQAPPRRDEVQRVMVQARSENFPVASIVLPRRVRADMLAVYGFARLVDDTGDEAEGDRVALLDELQADLERAWGGTPRHPLIARLQPTVRNRALPIEPFRKLIEANRRDQLVRRYETYDELLGYCALSAASVGEIVLRIFELATPERIALSDKVCNALQLVEHWQDVGEDYAADRIYLPAEDRRRFGVADAELAAPHAGPRLRALIDFEVARTRGLLAEGAPLVRTLRGRWAVAVAAFVAGGRAALGAIERADHDVLGTPVQAGPVRRAVELGRLLSASVSRR